ncbi:MAG: hypothetical protein MUF87_03365 [Anaerolineae bacterium]|jgi:indole-3-glycerol phosphate synthase|nr:hypothetical protein [Anaerolineae bacterium]
MTVERFTVDTTTIIATKREKLRERQAKTPTAAVIALAEMQMRPRPVLNIVTGGETIAVIGVVDYSEIYDPVGTALRYTRLGVDAVAFFTDSSIYENGLEDLLLVSRGIKSPVISQDYILDGYHVAEARASGASALTLYASVLDHTTLRRVVSLTQRWRMTALVQVENEAQVNFVRSLSPHVIAVGSITDHSFEANLALFERLRPTIPYNMKCMLHCTLTTLDQVAAILKFGVDALLIHEQILTNSTLTDDLYRMIDQHRPR